MAGSRYGQRNSSRAWGNADSQISFDRAATSASYKDARLFVGRLRAGDQVTNQRGWVVGLGLARYVHFAWLYVICLVIRPPGREYHQLNPIQIANLGMGIANMALAPREDDKRLIDVCAEKAAAHPTTIVVGSRRLHSVTT